MIDGDAFIAALSREGIDLFSGVPCSFLTPLMNAAISRPGLDYIGATSEGEAVAIASGAWLAGRLGAAMMQNSGLGNAVNPLTSLCNTLDIPCLVIVTHRGAPDISDEPQHAQMGRITAPLLALMDIPVLPFPETSDDIASFAAKAARRMRRTRRPVATILPKGRVATAALDQTPVTAPPPARIDGAFTGAQPPKRSDVLRALLDGLPRDAGLVATTGFCARELYATSDLERNLYVVGSMGCASAIGHGIARASGRRIAVLDGDGAMLMKLGNTATIGAEAPEGLIHILLDNGVHESTGRQATVAPGVDFASIAVATGYRNVWRVDDMEGLGAALPTIAAASGPTFLHVRVRPSDWPDLPRPAVTPPDAAARFRDFIGRGA